MKAEEAKTLTGVGVERIVFTEYFALVRPYEPLKKRACLRCKLEFRTKAGNRICVQCAYINKRLR